MKNIIEVLKRYNFFERLFLADHMRLTDENQVDYWRQSIFMLLSLAMIIFGGPTVMLGAIMFYLKGAPILSFIEVFLYVSLGLVVVQKRLSMIIRKIYLVSVIYLLAILLLVYTGPLGAGMTTVFFSLILLGLLFEKNILSILFRLNIIFFLIMTILLYTQVFEAFPIEQYKETWFINIITVQACGIVLIKMTNFVFERMEFQNQKVLESKNEIDALYQRDPLTGLLNRQLMDEKIAMLDTPNAYPVSIIYGDLNGLKLINDEFGHEAGDILLITISDIMMQSTRASDLVFRIGGDEFLILLPNTNENEALVVMNHIQNLCTEYNYRLENYACFLSISMGLSIKETENEDVPLRQTIKVAEDGMYRKKNHSRSVM